MRVEVAGCLVLSVLALVGCGVASDDRPTTLNAGYAFGADAGDAGDRIAFREAEEALRLEIVPQDMGGSENAIVGLVRGDVALASIPYHLVVAAISQGAKVEMVLASNTAAEFVIVGRPGLDGVEDLEGARIANSLSGGDTIVHGALREAGLSIDDVRLSALRDSPAKAAALTSGRADAATLEYIDYERLRAEGEDVTLVARQVDVFPPFPAIVWAVSSEWADENRELLRELVDAMLDGYATLYGEDGEERWVEEADAIVPGEDPELLKKAFAYYRKIGFWPKHEEIYGTQPHDVVMRTYVEIGALEQAEPFERVWDTSFWEDASAG